MKKLLTLFLLSLMIFACKGHSNTEKPKAPDNPVVAVEEAILKKAILKHFALLDSKDENKTILYAASGACKKIKANVDTDAFKLSSVEHLAYDDELGTFKIKVTGSIKINGKMHSFSNQEVQFENFKFPLDGKTDIVGLKKFDIDMKEAKKHKPSVENFLKNCTDPVTSLIFILSDNKDFDFKYFKEHGITAKIVCKPYKVENAQVATGVKVGVVVNQLIKETGKQEEVKIFPFNLEKVASKLIKDPLFVEAVEEATLKKAILKQFSLLDANDETKVVKYAASGACKKIVANVDTDAFKLSSVEHLAYNDELGTFKIKVTGSIKINGKMQSFSNQELQFKDFEFPLSKGLDIVRVKDFDVDMTEAEKHKPSVENFLKNCTNPVTKLSFILSNNDEFNVDYFKNHGITAKIVCKPYKAENAQVATGVKVGVIVNQLIKETGTQEEVKIFPFNLEKVASKLIKDPLFLGPGEKALKKAKEEIATLKEQGKLILVDKDEYASSYWAWIHYVDKMLPINYMTEELQAVLKKYEDHKITIGIVHSACEINLKADDFKGTLKIPLVVATTENIADQTNLKDEFVVELQGFKTIEYEIKQVKILEIEGANLYESVPKYCLKDDNDIFKLISRRNEKYNGDLDDEANNNNYIFKEFFMYKVDLEDNVFKVKQTQFISTNKEFDKNYKFEINDTKELDKVLGFKNTQKYPLCKTLNGKEIFVKSIRIRKDGQSYCLLKIEFMGELSTKAKFAGGEVDMEPVVYAFMNPKNPE